MGLRRAGSLTRATRVTFPPHNARFARTAARRAATAQAGAVASDPPVGQRSALCARAARFAGVGFPGETYHIAYWKEGDKILVQAKSKERDAPIISNCAITVRS